MCFDDGPGIRTTVFLQGCSLCCPWCCNPETQRVHDESSCDENHELYDLDDIKRQLMKDLVFWQNGGGVTLSGGEPLLQSRDLRELCVYLKELNVNIVVETSMFVPTMNLDDLIPFVDLWYVDVKILDTNMCKMVLHGDIKLFEKNVAYLRSRNCKIHFRMPCSSEYTLQEKNWDRIVSFLKNYSNYPVDIFPIHNLAKRKYLQKGMKYIEFETIQADKMKQLCQCLMNNGINASLLNL